MQVNFTLQIKDIVHVIANSYCNKIIYCSLNVFRTQKIEKKLIVRRRRSSITRQCDVYKMIDLLDQKIKKKKSIIKL